MVTNSPYIFLSELESSPKPSHRPTEAVKVWFLLLHGCIAWKFRRCSRELPRKLSRQESSAKDRDQKLSMCWPTRCKNIQSGPPRKNTLQCPGCLSLGILYTEGLNWKWLCKSTHLLLLLGCACTQRNTLSLLLHTHTVVSICQPCHNYFK